MVENRKKHYDAPVLTVDRFVPDTIVASSDKAEAAAMGRTTTAKERSAQSSPMNGDAQSCLGTNTVVGDDQGNVLCAW